jgi:hypothetical protein
VVIGSGEAAFLSILSCMRFNGARRPKASCNRFRRCRSKWFTERSRITSPIDSKSTITCRQAMSNTNPSGRRREKRIQPFIKSSPRGDHKASRVEPCACYFRPTPTLTHISCGPKLCHRRERLSKVAGTLRVPSLWANRHSIPMSRLTGISLQLVGRFTSAATAHGVCLLRWPHSLAAPRDQFPDRDNQALTSPRWPLHCPAGRRAPPAGKLRPSPVAKV